MTESVYHRRVAQGKCGSCGKEDHDPDSTIGPICREKARVRAAAKRKNRAPGACIDCGKPTDGGIRCDACKKYQKENRDKRTVKKKAAGICTASGCHKPAKDGCTLCQGCIDYRSEVSSKHYFRRKNTGLCRFCNNAPEDGYTMCGRHRTLYRDYRFRIKMKAFEHYGLACALCGCDDMSVLEIDHIAGGGCKHRKEVSAGAGGYSFYLWLKRENYPEGFRTLCPTCNKKAYVECVAIANASTP